MTSFEYQLHEVTMVLAGLVIHPFERAREMLKFYSEFSRAIPDELNTIAVLLTLPELEKVGAKTQFCSDCRRYVLVDPKEVVGIELALDLG